MFNGTNNASYGGKLGVDFSRKMRGPAHQASFAQAKNNPDKKAMKQKKTNETMAWLVAREAPRIY
jgi:hypothetical protein